MLEYLSRDLGFFVVAAFGCHDLRIFISQRHCVIKSTQVQDECVTVHFNVISVHQDSDHSVFLLS